VLYLSINFELTSHRMNTKLVAL